MKRAILLGFFVLLGCDDGGSTGAGGTSSSGSSDTSSGSSMSSGTTSSTTAGGSTTSGASGSGSSSSSGGGPGMVIWEKPTSLSSVIGADQLGNVYVGAPGKDGDFGATPPTVPPDLGFFSLTKLDPTGQVAWSKFYDSGAGTMDVGPGANIVLTSSTLVTKVAPDGAVQWSVPHSPGGGPYFVSADGRVWGPRDVFDIGATSSQWRAPSGGTQLREFAVGAHVVSVKLDNPNGQYLIEAMNLDLSPLWSKTIPKPMPQSSTAKLFMQLTPDKRTVIRQHIAQGDASSAFDVGCGPLSSALVVLDASGGCIWSKAIPTPVTAADNLPFTAQEGIIQRSTPAGVQFYDNADGAIVWTFPGDPNSALTPAARDGNTVFVLGIHGAAGGVARIQ